MSFLVVNCFHWVGFHLVNDLLQNGHKVDGIDCDDSSGHDHLSMFVGRNSLFSLIREEETGKYHVSIIVESILNKDIKTNYTLEMDHSKLSNHLHKSHLFIKLPLLFGEWMPMNENGMYYKNEFMPFNSEQFLTEAVYIGDYMEELYKWMETVGIFDEEIKNKQEKKKELKSFTYTPNNRLIQSQLDNVLVHYNRFSELYK